MATKLPATDIVIIGLGWTGSIIAESMTKAGFNVVAIKRGPWRDTATDFPPNYAADELRYAIRYDLQCRPAQTTLTFRNNASQTALPVRNWGAFLLPNGVGGAGVHWNAEIWRFLPTDFPPSYSPDELRYAVRHDLFVRPAQTTFTFRNNMSQTALPIRTWGAFLMPNGVGGAGVHWNAETWRFLPSDFVLKTHFDPALRREIPAPGHGDPGLGRHL